MIGRDVLNRSRVFLIAALLALSGGVPVARAAEGIEQKDVDIAVVRDP